MAVDAMRYAAVLCLLAAGCIKTPQSQFVIGAPAVAPPSPALVAACNKTQDWHNVWVVAGSILGGLGGAGGTVSGLTSDQMAKTGIAIGAGASGFLGGVAAVSAGLEAARYASLGCDSALRTQAAIEAAERRR